MRVNQPQIRSNSQRTQQRQQAPAPYSNTQSVHRETEVMQLARKIKAEQGAKTAGCFLFAMKPFTAPNEIAHIERELNIRCECERAQPTQQGSQNGQRWYSRRMGRGARTEPKVQCRREDRDLGEWV